MPLCEVRHLEHFQKELGTLAWVTFRGVRLPDADFVVRGDGGADVLFVRREDGSGYLLLIDDGVRYTGRNEALRQAFAAPARQGWRFLAEIREVRPELVLRIADRLLGLDGGAPAGEGRDPTRGRRPMPRELVLSASDIAQEGADPRGGDEGERFGVDLVREARAGRLVAPLFREKETAALLRILSKAGKNAGCLVGPSGVGKTAVVEGLAIAVAEGWVPEALAKARILDVNLSLLAAGASFRNEFEGRMKQVLDLARRNPNVILFLDELHTIRNPSNDASQMVKSDLGRGRIRCIGATTNEEFRAIEEDAALARRFQVVPVLELTPTQTFAVLQASRPHFERHHGVRISDDLLSRAVDLAARYVSERHFPDKALDLLDEACASASFSAVGARAGSRAGRGTAA